MARQALEDNFRMRRFSGTSPRSRLHIHVAGHHLYLATRYVPADGANAIVSEDVIGIDAPHASDESVS